MKKSIFALLSIILVTACASKRLNEGLPHLVGYPISHAISFLGYPQSQQEIAGKKVYTWSNKRQVTTSRTVRTPISGTTYGMGGGTYYHGYATSEVPQTINYECTIRLIANQKDIVQKWDWSGNELGCRQYSTAAQRIKDIGELWKRAEEDKKLRQLKKLDK